nr:MAG TPA: hypothetical protein [Caudoviricetes sp.]
MEKLIRYEKAIRILCLFAILFIWNSITDLLFLLLSIYLGFQIIDSILKLVRKVEDKWILRKY